MSRSRKKAEEGDLWNGYQDTIQREREPGAGGGEMSTATIVVMLIVGLIETAVIFIVADALCSVFPGVDCVLLKSFISLTLVAGTWTAIIGFFSKKS